MIKRFSEVKNRFMIYGGVAILLLSVLTFFTTYFINQILTRDFINKYLETESVQLLNLRIEVENTLFELSTGDKALLDQQKGKLLEGLSAHVKNREAIYAVVLSPDGQIIEYTHPQKYDELKPIDTKGFGIVGDHKPISMRTPEIKTIIDEKTFQKFYEMRIPISSNKENNGMIKVFISQRDIMKRLDPMLIHIQEVMVIASAVGGSIFLIIGLIVFYLLHSTRVLQSQMDEEKHFAEVGSIAAGMAHEIKNPLNAIGMNLQMIQGKLLENNQVELGAYINHKIENALIESKRLEGLLNGFLHYSRQDEPLDEVEVETIIKECVELLRVEADAKKIMLIVNGSTSDKILCGRGKLKQIFINLILNAIQNTESGFVELVIGNSTSNNIKYVNVKIIDTGIGIKKEDQAKIFNMFYTTRKHGTGLGLHVARALLDEFHGKISLERSDHTGTVFLVELPSIKK